MNKKAIRSIIILMSMSLLGLIGLQAYWIWLKVAETRQEFDASVFKSLSAISQQLEEKEAVVFIQNLQGGLFSDSDENTFTYVIDLKEELHEQASLKKKVSQHLEKEAQVKQRVIFSERGADYNIEILEDKGNETAQEAEIIQLFAKKKNKLNTALNKIALNYTLRSNSLSERLNDFALDSIIQQNLKNQGITTNQFEYYIVETSTDSVVLASDSSRTNMSINQAYSTPILTEELNQSGGVLSLEFKNRSRYILQTIWLSLLVSIFLTAILIFTFSYTIYAIFRQKKMSQIKSDFINNMTHEFKTPIATISLAVDSMLHPLVRKDEHEIEKYGAIIKKENARMNDQIERVLEVAKFEKGEFHLALKLVKVDEVLAELYESFNLSMNNKSGDIQLVLTAENHLVMADRLHLYNALRNIIENGIKFSPKAFRIRISSENKGDKLIIHIEDKGIGMDAETQKRVFDRFYRRTEGNIHSTKGFGLGLNYVKEIIEGMQGKISVRSKLKEGSCFSIEIPIQNA